MGGKPDPSVYRHVLHSLGTKPSESWIVGDNLEWNMDGPQRQGLHGVWVDLRRQGLPESGPVVPHRIIRAFPELLA